eukprot:TRINITY_DN19248_c0_g1_i1.p1 TRINITY_DN19248_c0_g1~~TRINITY_DN19248_c0_g1_i1.p1  ORF type:complete len:1220 (-),score=232.36 TRINITY_DN19248_c0_g1_i1:32-3691(-)
MDPGMTQASMTADGVQSAATHPKRSVGAVEMLEFCKSLNIDPVNESDMLWIAEDAFHAPLPVGWTEHQNENGHTYFHNTSTGQSVWQHPLDGLFRDCVEYYREVNTIGGFWGVDGRISDMEEEIRRDLHDWIELFDEHGEKYYFHRITEQSRFDDPRNELYHSLYQRIKMVSKMKERLPLLARAPLPDEPTPYELRLQKVKMEEEKAFLRSVCKCQALARMIAAKRRVQYKLTRRDVGRGYQPLKGRLRLRLHMVESGKTDVLLAETTPHRRHKAAAKIQAHMRGVLQRKHFTPMLQHREYRCMKITFAQRVARRYVARKRAEREAKMRVVRAAMTLQSIFRGFIGRREAKNLKEQLDYFNRIITSAIKIQCRMRVWLAKTEAFRRRKRKYDTFIKTIQGMMRIDKARKKLLNNLPFFEPIQSYFVMTPAESGVSGFMPYSFLLTAAPIDEKGKMKRNIEYGYINLWKNGSQANVHNLAAEVIQKWIRGTLARIEYTRRINLAEEQAEEARRLAEEIYSTRFQAARLIQSRFRGWIVRHKDILGRKYLRFIDNNMPGIKEIQAKIEAISAQIALREHRKFLVEEMASSTIQRHWRGWMARQQFDLIDEQSLWPFKLWFEYTSTGPNSVFVGIKSFANPRFDMQRFFMTYGGMWMLEEPIEDMEKEVTVCVDHMEATEQGDGGGSQIERSIGEIEEVEDGSEAAEGEMVEGEAEEEDLQELMAPPVCELCLAEGAGEPCLCCRFRMLEAGLKKEREVQAFVEQSEAEAQANPEVAQVEAQTDAIAELEPLEVPAGAATEGTTTELTAEEIQLLVDSGQPLPPGVSVGGGDAASPTAGDSTAAGDANADSLAVGIQDQPENEEEPCEPGEGQGNQRASMFMGSSEDGRALRRLKEGKYEAVFDDPAATVKRKTYAGTFTNGRFERTRAANLNDLTDEQRQQVLDDLEEERRMKVEELVKRQRKLAQKRRTSQRREVATVHAGLPPQKSQELRKWLRRKDELQAMTTMNNQQAATITEMETYEQALTEVRERRLRIADKRRTQVQKGMSMGDTVSASMYSMKGAMPAKPGDVPMMGRESSIEQRMMTGMLKKDSSVAPSFPHSAQRVLHRHVHHHMHHHTGEGVEDMMSPNKPSHQDSMLPALATDMGVARGVNSGMRRSFSDSGSGGTSLTRNQQRVSSQILPTKGCLSQSGSVVMASTRKAGSRAGTSGRSVSVGNCPSR